MIELLWLSAVGLVWVFVAPNLMPDRPPRHARPEGRTGPTMPAPSPIVSPTMTDEQRQVLRHTVPELGAWRLSPLSRESMRRRFRIMWAERTGRPVV